ncbi:MAG TPA: septum formation initiator family protein [Fibrobacteraceae bacterium]|nr:septum formation initiator family protein [Fibrobacteraceae bacterium]
MVKIVGRALLVVLCLYGAAKLVLGNNGLLRQTEVSRENEELRGSIDSLERLLESLRQENLRLKTDSFYIEKIARIHFGMSRPGELVYQFLPSHDSLMKDSTHPPTDVGLSE